MKHAAYLSVTLIGASLEFLALIPKPSVPALPPHPSSKAISNVEMTPDYALSAAADAGKATEEIAVKEAAATAGSTDAIATDVVSLGFNSPVLADEYQRNPVAAATAAGFSIADQMKASSDAYRGFVRTSSPELTAAAQYHADFMARYPCRLIGDTYNNAAFSHDTNGGSSYRVKRHGWNGSYQEILAMRPAGWRADCWELWRGSPGHWQAVMSNTTHCGFGVATNPNDGCTYYVGLYGNQSPAPSATAIPAAQPCGVCQGAGTIRGMKCYACDGTGIQKYPPAARSAVSYSVCGPNGCRQVFVPQQPQQPRPRQYVQQPQQWQYESRGLFGRRR